jgi:hypothetical protein
MSEQLTGLKKMAPFADLISKAENLYMPSAVTKQIASGSHRVIP